MGQSADWFNFWWTIPRNHYPDWTVLVTMVHDHLTKRRQNRAAPLVCKSPPMSSLGKKVKPLWLYTHNCVETVLLSENHSQNVLLPNSKLQYGELNKYFSGSVIIKRCFRSFANMYTDSLQLDFAKPTHLNQHFFFRVTP